MKCLRSFGVILACGLTLGSLSAHAAAPKEAVGFWGTVTGAVKSAQKDGASFVLKVATAEPDEKKNKAADPAAIVGKELTLAVRMPRKDGKPYPSEEDVAYIKSLKPGMTIRVKVFAVMGDPRILRIQSPGETVNEPGK